jgi:phosphatidylglycerol:prolipoprotein diacylglycerol transferase
VLPTIVIFGKSIGTYSLATMAGLLLLVACLYRLPRMRGYDGADEIMVGIWCIVPTVVGASLLFAFTNAGYIVDVLGHAAGRSFTDVIADIVPAFSGLVFYGGLLGCLVGIVLWCRVHHEPLARHMDVWAVGVPAFHCCGRVGCFLGGCCYGIESPFGFTYTLDPIATANGVCRFPVQLLEAALELILFLVLVRLYRTRRLEGHLMFAYLMSYAVVRFLDEFLRGDAYRGFFGPLSTSQWISLAILSGCIVLLMCDRRQGRDRGIRQAQDGTLDGARRPEA